MNEEKKQEGLCAVELKKDLWQTSSRTPPSVPNLLLNKSRALSIMEKYGLDALIATTPANVTYLSDYRALSHEHLGSFVSAIFPRDKNIEPTLILPSGEVADLIALRMSWFHDIRTYGTFFITVPNQQDLTGWEASVGNRFKSKSESDPFVLVKNALSEKGLLDKHLGIDEKGFKGEDYHRFVKAIGAANTTNAYEIFREIRKIKNGEEVAIIREANAVTEKGIRAVLENVHIGSNGADLWKVFGETVAGLGVVSFAPSISLGTDSYLQYNFVPSTRKLESGDLIRFDVACTYKYHFTDIGRNAVLGKPSSRQIECYNVVFGGEDSAISSLKPGTKASEVFNAGVEGARSAGMPNFQRNHCGHGIGMELYEHPLITPTSDHIIEPGCVLNIETPYYEIGNGGYMVEDTLLVTNSGVEFLTKLDRGLIEIPI